MLTCVSTMTSDDLTYLLLIVLGLCVTHLSSLSVVPNFAWKRPSPAESTYRD